MSGGKESRRNSNQSRWKLPVPSFHGLTDIDWCGVVVCVWVEQLTRRD